MADLLAHLADRTPETLAPGAMRLPGFALAQATALLGEVDAVTARSPFRHLTTRRGGTIAAAMTNCGALGWVSDRRGYRYEPLDPLSGAPWPAMPAALAALARMAAATAGFAGYDPDCCLINRYAPGTGMGLHQDRDEQDAESPIVSVSLGLPAVFLWGGLQRTDPTRRIALLHGDVVVWGGPARFTFHGIARLKPGEIPARINVTFRRTGRPAAAAHRSGARPGSARPLAADPI